MALHAEVIPGHVEDSGHAQRRIDQEAPERVPGTAWFALQHVVGQDHRRAQVAEHVADTGAHRARHHVAVGDRHRAQYGLVDGLMHRIHRAVERLGRVVVLIEFRDGIRIVGRRPGRAAGQQRCRAKRQGQGPGKQRQAVHAHRWRGPLGCGSRGIGGTVYRLRTRFGTPYDPHGRIGPIGPLGYRCNATNCIRSQPLRRSWTTR